MADTVRTDAYLVGSEFPNNITSGGITPQSQRDFVVSKINVMDFYDDPNNASGLSAPAIVRGSIRLEKVAGFTPTPPAGQFLTQAVMAANATALQNALNYASNNNKNIEVGNVTFQFYSSTGLILPWSGTSTVWQGCGVNSVFKNFYNTSPGCPVMTVGDKSGSGGCYYFDIRDFGNFQQGNSNTGNTASRDVVIGGMLWSRISGLFSGNRANPGPQYPSWHGVEFIGGNPTFSCIFEHWQVNGAQQDIMHVPVLGTGNVFRDFYINGGGQQGTSPPVINGNMLALGAGGAMTEQLFERFNLEWCSTNNPLNISNLYGCRFSELHMEGLNLTGANPYVINSNFLNIIDIQGWICETMNTSTASGTGAYIRNYQGGGSCLNVRNVCLFSGAAGDAITIPMQFMSVTNERDNGSSCYTIQGFRQNDGTGNLRSQISLDPHMPVSGSQFYLPNIFNDYRHDSMGSVLTGADITVATNYNHYGQLSDAHLQVPSSLSSAISITLMHTMGLTGNEPVAVGTRVHVRRSNSGSFSNNCSIYDQGNGTALIVNTSTNQDYFFRFNGSNWAVFTAVS